MAGWFFSKPFRRNNYFYGKLLTSRDFENEQAYMNDKRRLINECVLGAGVVFGLGVSLSQGNLILRPGAAIDPRGRELINPETASFRLEDILARPEREWPEGEAYYVCVSHAEFGSEETLRVANPEHCNAPETAHNYITEGIRVALVSEAEMPPMWRLGGGDIYGAARESFMGAKGAGLEAVKGAEVAGPEMIKSAEVAGLETIKSAGGAGPETVKGTETGAEFLMKCAEIFRDAMARAIDADERADPPVCLAKLVKKNGEIALAGGKDAALALSRQFVFSPAFLYDMAEEALGGVEALGGRTAAGLEALTDRLTLLEKAAEKGLAKLSEELSALTDRLTLLEKASEKGLAKLSEELSALGGRTAGLEELTKKLGAAAAELRAEIDSWKSQFSARLSALENAVEFLDGQLYNTLEFVVESELDAGDVLLSDPIKIDYPGASAEFEYAVELVGRLGGNVADLANLTDAPLKEKGADITFRPPAKAEYEIRAYLDEKTPGAYRFEFKALKAAGWIGGILLKWRVKKVPLAKTVSLTPKNAKAFVGESVPLTIRAGGSLSDFRIIRSAFRWKAQEIQPDGGSPADADKRVSVAYDAAAGSFVAVASSPGVYRLTVTYISPSADEEFSDSMKLSAAEK